MKVNFNFDTGARRIRLTSEDPLEELVLKEMSFLCEKGVNMKIANLTDATPLSYGKGDFSVFEIEMRINGFAEGKEKKSE